GRLQHQLTGLGEAEHAMARPTAEEWRRLAQPPIGGRLDAQACQKAPAFLESI
ncbi:hypothetical protein E4U54_005902, partial [Claviceps lovelessii]